MTALPMRPDRGPAYSASTGSVSAALRSRRPRRRADAAQATVEFALVLPVLAMLLLLLGQVLLVAHDQLLVTHAAREAARAAAVADGDAAAAARAAARRAGSLDDGSLTTSVARTGDRVTVTVSYGGTDSLPLLGPIVDDLVLRASVTMQVEP